MSLFHINRVIASFARCNLIAILSQKIFNLNFSVSSIVLKLGSVFDSARVLGHWVNGRTTESLVEPHD